MDAVPTAFQAREIIALLEDVRRAPLRLGNARPLKVGKGRNVRCWTHVGPDHTAGLADWIAGLADLVFEVAVHRLGGLIEAATFDVVFPAMVETAESAFLVASQR